jgi:hypothetical protein
MELLAGEAFHVLQQQAQRISAALQSGTPALSTSDEDALLSAQLELSVALEAEALNATQKQQQQNNLTHINTTAKALQPFAASGGNLLTPQQHQPDRSALNQADRHHYGQLNRPHFPSTFPNAASIEPRSPHSHSHTAQPSLLQQAWNYGGAASTTAAARQPQGHACTLGVGNSTGAKHLAQHEDGGMSSDFDDDALFDVGDAALAQYTANQNVPDASTGAAAGDEHPGHAYNSQHHHQ